MNIGSRAGYPASTLSNFSGHRFVIDNVECNSMEGFLQALKYTKSHMQVEVCKLVGRAAKMAGKGKNWRTRQILNWQGIEYKRDSKEYQDLLDRAYQAMYDQCESFRDALKASGNATLEHTMGKSKEADTVLTINEFCGRLTRLRETGKVTK